MYLVREREMLEFEGRYGIRSETFYAVYAAGEEDEENAWAMDFGEWASVYRTWLTRQAAYRNEVQRLQSLQTCTRPSLLGLVQAAT